VKKTYIQTQGDKSYGIAALSGSKAAYSETVRVDLADHTLLYISGKIGINAELKVASRNIREQTRQIFDNFKVTLEREGGEMTDIVRLRIYVSAIDSASIRDVHEVRMEYFEEGTYPASTLVRVDQFVRDGALIEIEADVVMPRAGS
jgi:enamine deaminase RidA (YjgF/YER057c/UK114 family)